MRNDTEWKPGPVEAALCADLDEREGVIAEIERLLRPDPWRVAEALDRW